MVTGFAQYQLEKLLKKVCRVNNPFNNKWGCQKLREEGLWWFSIMLLVQSNSHSHGLITVKHKEKNDKKSYIIVFVELMINNFK